MKETPAATEGDQTVKTPASADTGPRDETPAENASAAAETAVQEMVTSAETAAETAAEPGTRSTDAQKEVPTVTQSLKTEAEEAAAQTDDPVPSPDTSHTVATTTGSLQEAAGRGETEVMLTPPPGGEGPALSPEDVSLHGAGEDAEPVAVSDPDSLDVSVGSEAPISDLESLEDALATQSCEDQMSTASDLLESEAHGSISPASSSPQPQVEAVSGGLEARMTDTTTAQSSQPAEEDGPSSSASQPPDCIKEIRDLVVEVFEVEEVVQHYPSAEE